MTSNIILTPAADADSESSGKTKESSQTAGAGRSRTIPSRDECLQGIAALSGLVAMRILTPAQANTIRANFMAILREYEPARQAPSAHLPDEQVMELWRTHPELLDFIELLLTPEQLEMIMREVGRDADG
jgi:hypothetical protein